MYTRKEKTYVYAVQTLKAYKELEFIPLQVVNKKHTSRESRRINYVYEPLVKQFKISDSFLLRIDLNGTLTGLTLTLVNGYTKQTTFLKEIRFLGKNMVRGELGSIKYFAFDVTSMLKEKPEFRIVQPTEYYKALRKENS